MMLSDEDILERGGTQEDIESYAHDVGGACGAAYGGKCDQCVKPGAITSTPLPEQGGFNERLDAILEEFDHDRDYPQAKSAIRTLVLEEIINHDPANRFNCEALRAEQRKKLEDTNGTK